MTTPVDTTELRDRIRDKAAVFGAAARALRPGGRLAIADIVSERELIERTRSKPRPQPTSTG